MKVGIIGAGFAGLGAAIELAKSGHQVTVFERESQPGGLAIGFRDDRWDWPLEKHYHHWFTSDTYVRNLAARVGHPVSFIRPKTSTWFEGRIRQLDSPSSLLQFSALSLTDRIRTGAGLAMLRFNPFWQPLEHLTAKTFIRTVMGKSSWSVLWEPLFTGKFGPHAGNISAAWFWSRISKRSPALGYPDGGFQAFAESVAASSKKSGARYYYGVEVKSLNPYADDQVEVRLSDQRKFVFDAAICTLPTSLFAKITPSLPPEFVARYSRQPGLGAVNLVLALTKPFLADNTYWLNINDRTMPFLAVVEHTNFIDSGHYGGDHLVYIGNYLPADHHYFSLSAPRLVSEFLPHLKKISPGFSRSLIRKSWVWRAPFAQPIVTPGYSRRIPPLATPIPNLYLANIQQVYPHDRGTNYAVELGIKAARLCVNTSNRS